MNYMGSNVVPEQLLGTEFIKGIFYNSQVISDNVTIPATVNASSTGPIIVDTGYTVTVESGANWVIL
jgi:hypothetical protein